MNPIIQSTTSPLLLTLTQLSPHCSRLLNSLGSSNISQKERILCEQTLWNEVKKIRSSNDHSAYLYLIGFYHTILYQLSRLDNDSKSDLFQYHVLIRLGDLSRYMGRVDVAEYYYCNARNLFPRFGHAYNQLGLLTKPASCYKCCYYYARAAKSSEKSLNTIADSNLRIAVSKYNCQLLNRVLGYETDNSDSSSQNCLSNYPESAIDWFYVIVVAIYADNIRPVTKLFLKFMNENFSTQKSTTIINNVKKTTVYCDGNSYLLLASLDTILSWLKLGSETDIVSDSVTSELCQIRNAIYSTIASCRLDVASCADKSNSPKSQSCNSILNSVCRPHIMDSSDSHKISTDVSDSSSILHNNSSHTSFTDSTRGSQLKLTALPHDYVLRGFSLLDQAHEDLQFSLFGSKNSLEDELIEQSINQNDKFIQNDRLLQILTRIKSKMDAFGSIFKKQNRNIALESILSSTSRQSG